MNEDYMVTLAEGQSRLDVKIELQEWARQEKYGLQDFKVGFDSHSKDSLIITCSDFAKKDNALFRMEVAFHEKFVNVNSLGQARKMQEKLDAFEKENGSLTPARKPDGQKPPGR